MIESKHINALVHDIIDHIPQGLKQLPEDMEQHLREALIATFHKMNLVTCDEFNRQTKILERTRLKIESLEKQLEEFKKKINESS